MAHIESGSAPMAPHPPLVARYPVANGTGTLRPASARPHPGPPPPRPRTARVGVRSARRVRDAEQGWEELTARVLGQSADSTSTSSRPRSASASAYRRVLDPSSTRAGQRAARVVELLLPAYDRMLRATEQFGRGALAPRMDWNEAAQQPASARRRRSPPSVPHIPPAPVQPIQHTHGSACMSASERELSRVDWRGLYGFPSTPAFRFVNLHATRHIIAAPPPGNASEGKRRSSSSTHVRMRTQDAGLVPHNSNVQLAVLISSEGFWASPAVASASHVGGVGRAGTQAEQLQPTFTLSFQTHLPPLLSLADHTAFPPLGACPSSVGMRHALAAQYRALDAGRASNKTAATMQSNGTGDARLLRFALESALHALEHFALALQGLDWTLQLLPATARGSMLLFVGSKPNEPLHIIVAVPAQPPEHVAHNNSSAATPVPVPSPSIPPSAWLMHRSKLFLLHLPLDLAFASLSEACNALQPLPPVFGEGVQSLLEAWEARCMQPARAREEQERFVRQWKEDLERVGKDDLLSSARSPRSSRPVQAQQRAASVRLEPSASTTLHASPLRAEPTEDDLSLRRSASEPDSYAAAQLLVREDDDDTHGVWDDEVEAEEEQTPAQQQHESAVDVGPSPRRVRPTTAVNRPRTAIAPSRPSPRVASAATHAPSRSVDDAGGYFREPLASAVPALSVSASFAAAPSASSKLSASRVVRAEDQESHPAFGAVLPTPSYISASLLAHSYHERMGKLPPRLVRAAMQAEEGKEEEEEQGRPQSAGSTPAYVPIGSAALQSARRAAAEAAAAAASSSPRASPRSTRKDGRVTSAARVRQQHERDSTARSPSPVLSFFARANVRSYERATSPRAAHGASGNRDPSHSAAAGLEPWLAAAPTAATGHTLPVRSARQLEWERAQQQQQQQEEKAEEVKNKAVSYSRRSPAALTLDTAQAAASQSLAHALCASPASSDRDASSSPAPSVRGEAQDSFGAGGGLPPAPPRRTKSAFVRRASGGGAVVISGRVERSRPLSMSAAEGNATESSNAMHAAPAAPVATRPVSAFTPRTLITRPISSSAAARKEGDVDSDDPAVDRELLPLAEPRSPPSLHNLPPMPKAAASSSSAHDQQIDLASTQRAGYNSVIEQASHNAPMSFSALVLAEGTPLSASNPASVSSSASASAAHPRVVHIPAGHPLSRNRPVSPSSLAAAGVDLSMARCAAAECNNRLYAVSGLGLQLLRCEGCKSAVYCSTECMIEDWISGRHPRMCAQAQAQAQTQDQDQMGSSEPTQNGGVQQGEGWMDVRAPPPLSPSSHSAAASHAHRRATSAVLRSIAPDAPPSLGLTAQSHPSSARPLSASPRIFGAAAAPLVQPQALSPRQTAPLGLAFEAAALNSATAASARASGKFAADSAATLALDAAAEPQLQAPHSLGAHMASVAAQPLEPALSLSTRLSSRPRSARQTVASMLKLESRQPRLGGTSLTLALSPRSSERQQAEMQRAYTLALEQLRDGYNAAVVSPHPLQQPLPDSSRLLQLASKLRPAFARRLRPDQLSGSSSLSGANVPPAHLRPPTRPFSARRDAGARPSGGAVSLRRVGGGGARSAKHTPAVALASSGLESHTLVPGGLNAKLRSSSRPRSAISGSFSASASAAAAAAARSPSPSKGAWAAGVDVPRLFDPALERLARAALQQAHNQEETPTARARTSDAEQVMASSPPAHDRAHPPPVIPIVDLKRAIAAARPRSARLASHGRLAL